MHTFTQPSVASCVMTIRRTDSASILKSKGEQYLDGHKRLSITQKNKAHVHGFELQLVFTYSVVSLVVRPSDC